MNENLRTLEEKIAYLERHVTEQDKAMLEFSDQLARLRRELKGLRERLPTGAGGPTDEEPADQRPPHY